MGTFECGALAIGVHWKNVMALYATLAVNSNITVEDGMSDGEDPESNPVTTSMLDAPHLYHVVLNDLHYGDVRFGVDDPVFVRLALLPLLWSQLIILDITMVLPPPFECCSFLYNSACNTLVELAAQISAVDSNTISTHGPTYPTHTLPLLCSLALDVCVYNAGTAAQFFTVISLPALKQLDITFDQSDIKEAIPENEDGLEWDENTMTSSSFQRRSFLDLKELYLFGSNITHSAAPEFSQAMPSVKIVDLDLDDYYKRDPPFVCDKFLRGLTYPEENSLALTVPNLTTLAISSELEWDEDLAEEMIESRQLHQQNYTFLGFLEWSF